MVGLELAIVLARSTNALHHGPISSLGLDQGLRASYAYAGRYQAPKGSVQLRSTGNLAECYQRDCRTLRAPAVHPRAYGAYKLSRTDNQPNIFGVSCVVLVASHDDCRSTRNSVTWEEAEYSTSGVEVDGSPRNYPRRPFFVISAPSLSSACTGCKMHYAGSSRSRRYAEQLIP